MRPSMLKYCWVFSCVTIFGALAKMDYCSENIFNSSFDINYLQFTKELSSSEYAVISSFKSLHCCAKGYRSIQWFKDGKPYPWASDVSTFILYPEEANQTVYARSLSTIDTGSYSCQIANDSHIITHTINLTVFDVSRYTDDPLSTYDMPPQHFVKLGGTARMFCEAFVGKNDLPDENYDISWTRPGMNESQVLSNPRVFRNNVLREDGQVIGSYFYIKNVKQSDFDEYICEVSNSADQILPMRTTLIEIDWNGERMNINVPWLKVIFIITITAVIILLISMVFQHVFLSILLFCKGFRRMQDSKDDKTCDVLVCYMSCDTDFIKTTLAITLQKKYGYSVSYKQFIDPTLAAAAKQSRSVLVMGSPAMCSNDWTPKAIHNVLHYITLINNNVIFVPFKPLPEKDQMKSEDGRKLEEILKNISVIYFYGNRKSDMRLFWLKLRIALPTKKTNYQFSSDQLNRTTAGNISTKVNFLTLTKSKEGVEVLV